MSSKLVTDRFERIELMLNLAKGDTKDRIEWFEELVAKNTANNTKEVFNRTVWVNKHKFMGIMARRTGLRLKVLEDYYNILLSSEDIEENPRTLGMQQFHSIEVVKEYLAKHTFPN